MVVDVLGVDIGMNSKIGKNIKSADIMISLFSNELMFSL